MKKIRGTQKLLDAVLERPFFERLIPYIRVNGKSPLVVVVGDNGAGKSFLRRVTHAICSLDATEFMGLSMEGRSKSNIFNAFIYGDEETRSTGVNSAATILKGIQTCMVRQTPHVIFWDEPDLGMSDDLAAGVGIRIAEFAKNAPLHTSGIFVTTHNRAMAERLLEGNPTYLYLGSKKGPKTLEEWVARPIRPLDPEAVQEMSLQKFRRIQRLMRTLQKPSDPV